MIQKLYVHARQVVFMYRNKNESLKSKQTKKSFSKSNVQLKLKKNKKIQKTVKLKKFLDFQCEKYFFIFFYLTHHLRGLRTEKLVFLSHTVCEAFRVWRCQFAIVF